MHKSLLTHRRSWSWTPLLVCLLAFPVVANGQQEPSPRAGQPDAGQRMQTGDGLLSIQANFPQEIRVGEQFTYEVQVRNTSDNAALHDIKLRHREGSGVSIESVDVQGQQNQGQQNQGQQKQDKQKQDQQKQDKQKQDQQKQDQQKQDQQKQDQQKQGQQKQDQQKQSKKSSGESLTIDQLNPGESRTIRVTASVDKEGPVDACLLISSYTPSICLQSKAVKPELEIVKTAPDQSNRCEVIELTYAVKNDGSGTIEKFEVVDELADGLRTIEGEEQLVFEVSGGLKAGEVREFVARVYATKTGEFKSRAVAKATDSDLKSRSQNVGPKVVGADLQVQVKGSESVYSKQPVMFTATITNNGNAPAEDVEVNLGWPEQANLARVSDPQRKSQEGQAKQASQRKRERQQQPTPAVAEAGSANNQQQSEGQQRSRNQNQSENQQQMAQEQFSIGDLEPGQSVEFNYVVRPNRLEKVETRVEARAVCAIDAADQTAETSAQAMAATRIIRMPALQIYAVDGSDPVEVDNKVRYTIRVLNEGDAEDQQVRVTVKLPEGLEFDSANGPTEHQQDGNEVRFEPIETLGAGEEAEFTLTATTRSEGSVIFEAELESESLKSAVKAEEPTRLVNKSQTPN